MGFNERLYVARGVPKVREAALKLVDPQSGFRLGQFDLLEENPHAFGFLDTRTEKFRNKARTFVIRNVPELRAGYEREYAIQGALLYSNLINGSDADPNAPLSGVSGLPLISQKDEAEFEQVYLKLRKINGNSVTFIDGLKRADRMLGESLDHLAIVSAEDAAKVNLSDPNEIAECLVNAGLRGRREMYELLAIQNMFNALKERADEKR